MHKHNFKFAKCCGYLEYMVKVIKFFLTLLLSSKNISMQVQWRETHLSDDIAQKGLSYSFFEDGDLKN